MQKITISLLTANLFFALCAQSLFANQAVLLSDEQLDSVHAEGLFFNFDSSFGSLNNVVSSSVPAEQSPNSNNQVTTTDNPNLQTVNSTSNNSSSNSPATSDTTSSASPVSSSSPTEAQSSLNTNSTTSTSPTSTINPAVQFDVVANQSSNGQFDVGVSTTLNPTQNPNSTISIPGNTGIELPQTPEIPIPSSSSLLSGPANIVNVSDLSQQHLSSLVNINAAGSVVPVVLNITINMNSTVGQVNNSSSINVQNFTSYQFKN